MTDHSSLSSPSEMYTSSHSHPEKNQNFQVIVEEKMGTPPGSAIAIFMALCFKIPQVDPMGCKTHKSHKGKHQKYTGPHELTLSQMKKNINILL